MEEGIKEALKDINLKMEELKSKMKELNINSKMEELKGINSKMAELKGINSKMAELKSAVDKNKLQDDNILNTLEILSSKVDVLTKVINEKYSVKDNLLTYIVGAFAGGLIMGLSLYKRTRG